MTLSTSDARAVAADQELTEGVFRLGSRYCVLTPTYAYVGRLSAVTPMVYVLQDASTVFRTGPYENFFAGLAKGKIPGDPARVEPHTGSAGELIIDRAGAVLVRLKE